MSPLHSEPGGRPGAETALIVIAATISGVGLALWFAGELGGWLWHGHGPRLGLSGSPAVALRALRRPGDPASAWPRSTRSSLPPTWALYLIFSAALFAAIVAAFVVSSLIRAASTQPSLGAPHYHPRTGRRGAAPIPPARRGLPSRAAWASRRDVALLRVPRASTGRLVLGRPAGRRRAVLATEARASLLVLGPTQSGKTTGLAVPAILEWVGPVLATSVKTDLVRDTHAWRSQRGRAWVYDPTAATGLPASSWNPLGRCRDWHAARQTAAWLCDAAKPRAGTLGDEDFWYSSAAKLLAPHFLAAAVGGRSMADVVRWLDTQEEDEVAVLLDQAGVEDASRAAAASWGREERTRSSIYATAEIVLEAFADPTVAMSALSCEVRAEALLDGTQTSLYLCAPSHEQDRLRPVFSTLLRDVLTAAFEKAGRAGHPLDPPLLVVLDEAANIAPLRDLDTIASTAASHGIQLVTVWQDLAQIHARYGERQATVANNHRAKLFLSGVSDPATLEYVSRLLGEGDVGEASTTIDAAGASSTTRSRRERRLMTDAEIRRLHPGEAVLVYGHLQPARLKLRPWFDDAELRGRVNPSARPSRTRRHRWGRVKDQAIRAIAVPARTSAK